MATDSETLLAWYDRHARLLPWRVPPERRKAGCLPHPYHVWLSEVMLQQTTAAAVIPYFERFLARWPDVSAFADATLDDIRGEWSGLGYYRRASLAHRCAREIVSRHGGEFPRTEPALRMLPGIGVYSAAAIAAIAFDGPHVPVDGNVERVVSRRFAITAPLPEARRAISVRAQSLLPPARSGDFAQALMDLGAGPCAGARPRCGECPWEMHCEARKCGIEKEIPRRAPRKKRPERHAVAFYVERCDGAALIRMRPESGILAGMAELPGSEWRDAPIGEEEIRHHAPVKAHWREPVGMVTHQFTHLTLALTLYAARVPQDCVPASGAFMSRAALARAPLPSLTRKAIGLAWKNAHRLGR